MEEEDIIKLDTYAGIDISVKGSAKLLGWSYLEKEKADIYFRLAEIEYETAKIIQNQMRERHIGIARGLVQQSKDAIHLSNLLLALMNKWIERLDKGIKKED